MAANVAKKSAFGAIYQQTRKNLMIGEHTKLIVQVRRLIKWYLILKKSYDVTKQSLLRKI